MLHLLFALVPLGGLWVFSMCLNLLRLLVLLFVPCLRRVVGFFWFSPASLFRLLIRWSAVFVTVFGFPADAAVLAGGLSILFFLARMLISVLAFSAFLSRVVSVAFSFLFCGWPRCWSALLIGLVPPRRFRFIRFFLLISFLYFRGGIPPCVWRRPLSCCWWRRWRQRLSSGVRSSFLLVEWYF